MDSFTSNIVPSLIFFLAFFVAFSLVELLFILLLNRLEKRNWEFVIDHLIRLKVHHGKLVSFIAAIGILILLGAVYLFTPFFTIIANLSGTLVVLSVCLIAVMLIIYITTTRKVIRLDLEKHVHGYMYFMISFILYVFIVTLSSQSYGVYQNYVNKRFVTTTLKGVQKQLDEKEEKKILNLFRKEIREGGCEYVDYTQKEGSGLTHFIYVTTDEEFIETVGSVQEPLLKGKECSNEENTFLLNSKGKWYWVIAEEMEVTSS